MLGFVRILFATDKICIAFRIIERLHGFFVSKKTFYKLNFMTLCHICNIIMYPSIATLQFFFDFKDLAAKMNKVNLNVRVSERRKINNVILKNFKHF